MLTLRPGVLTISRHECREAVDILAQEGHGGFLGDATMVVEKRG